MCRAYEEGPSTLGLYGALASIPSRCFNDVSTVQVLPSFVDKVVQLFESKLVRHANMLVGHTGTGKSTAWRCLQRALARLHREYPSSDLYQKACAQLVSDAHVTHATL